MEQDVNSDVVATATATSKYRSAGTFDSERAKKAVATKLAPPASVPATEVDTFRVLSEADKEAQLRAGLMENEFIAQYLDRQQMLSPNKKERMQTGMAVRVGIYNDKRNKQQSQSAPQNLIINLFNSSSAGPRLSQTLGCHGVTARVAQVVDSTVSSVPQEGARDEAKDE